MIVCHCNVLTDRQILATLESEPPSMPRSPVQAYKCLGCAPNCGRCLATVRDLLKSARAEAACAQAACAVGCPACPGHAAETHANDDAPLPLVYAAE